MKTKIVTVIIILTLVISATSAGFCSTNIEPKGSSGDRFKYEYETTSLKLVSTTKITKEQAQNIEKAKNIAITAISTIPWLGQPTALIILIGSSIYDMNQAGTIKAYSSKRIKYKVNVITGARSIVGQWRTATFKLYNTSGSLVTTKTQSIREK